MRQQQPPYAARWRSQARQRHAAGAAPRRLAVAAVRRAANAGAIAGHGVGKQMGAGDAGAAAA